MSLKAKIEAVIYASEEPVTLAQLTGLLGEEGQAELDALAAQQHSLALEDERQLTTPTVEPVEDADALNAETTDPTEVLEPADEPHENAVILSEARARSRRTPTPPDPPTEKSADEPRPTPHPTPKPSPPPPSSANPQLRDYFRSLLDQLIADYANGDRGLEIREVAGGFRLATKPEYHDAVRGFVKSLKPPLKLTLQALETLAVVAYKQPVTAPEVSEIRGVDSAGVLGSLLTRKLITTAGRKQVIGRPILYKTTKDFLLRFGLKDINELPSIEEFEKMAGELNDAVQEEIPMEAARHPHPAAQEAASADPSSWKATTSSPRRRRPPLADPDPIPEAPDAPTSEPESIPEEPPPTSNPTPTSTPPRPTATPKPISPADAANVPTEPSRNSRVCRRPQGRFTRNTSNQRRISAGGIMDNRNNPIIIDGRNGSQTFGRTRPAPPPRCSLRCSSSPPSASSPPPSASGSRLSPRPPGCSGSTSSSPSA